MKKYIQVISIFIVLILNMSSCNTEEVIEGKYKVIATTTMLRDLSEVIGGDLVEVKGLMGPGIDPHLYKASAGDVVLMQNADLIVYNGLHLEGKMGEIFENLSSDDKIIAEIASGIDKEKLLAFTGDKNLHDPHIWFDVSLWKDASKVVLDKLVELDSDSESSYKENYENYIKELDELDEYVKKRVLEVEKEKRILVTAHDAFAYFGAAYGFDVKGLQGISTASEAGTRDVKDLSEFIVEKEIKAIFIETSVPKRNIQALQEAIRAKGFDVLIGGELYSDSIGSKDSEASTYIDTVKHNIDTIVDALK